MNNVGGFLETLWNTIRATHAAPGTPVVLATLALAVALVAIHPIWRISRNVVTIAHEGAHALVALMARRRLAGIRLHSDTSGVTVSSGRPTGPGMVFTTAAGYIGPSLLGLGAAYVLAHGYSALMLWSLFVLLALMLAQIRNLYGFFTVVITGAVVFGVCRYTPDAVQSVVAYAVTWFLLVSGPRPVIELQRTRARMPTPESDADQLRSLTGLPGIVWVGFFFVVTIACFGLGARLLLGF